jgi:hypothetical protein
MRLITLFSLFFLALGMAGQTPPLRTIPIRIYDSLPLVRVRIGDSAARWYVVDSAAAHSYVAPRDRARRRVLSIGRTIIDVPARTVEPSLASEWRWGHAVDGIVGAELFGRYVVQIDYDAEVLRLFEPGTFQPDAGAEGIPLLVRGGKAYVRAAVTMSGKPETEELFLVDLASADAISGAAFARTDVPRNTPGRDLGRAAHFRIGTFAFDEVNGVAAPNHIGGEILHRFTLTFDWPRGMLWLEPSRHFGDGFIFDMSGLDLQWRRLQKEIEVMHVFDGTPAAEAGLRTGDRIVNIDHQPVTAFDLAQIRRMFHEPRSYTVDFRRGSREISVVLRLRKLL